MVAADPGVIDAAQRFPRGTGLAAQDDIGIGGHDPLRNLGDFALQVLGEVDDLLELLYWCFRWRRRPALQLASRNPLLEELGTRRSLQPSGARAPQVDQTAHLELGDQRSNLLDPRAEQGRQIRNR